MRPLRVLIVGGGKLGRESARRLVAAGHQVTVVEKDPATAQAAVSALSDHVTRGDGCDPRVLERAGIAQANVVAALTGDDEDNLVVAELARRVFGVEHVLARVNNPDNEWLFTRQRGVDLAFNPAGLVSSLLEQEVARDATG